MIRIYDKAIRRLIDKINHRFNVGCNVQICPPSSQNSFKSSVKIVSNISSYKIHIVEGSIVYVEYSYIYEEVADNSDVGIFKTLFRLQGFYERGY